MWVLFLFMGCLYNKVKIVWNFFFRKFRCAGFQWGYNEVPE